MGKGVTIERSHRLDGIGEYYFSRRLREIAETEAATGRQIIKLAMGSPDLPPAQTVIDTLAREAQRPNSCYMRIHILSFYPQTHYQSMHPRSILR